jgi:hypothetical protein
MPARLRWPWILAALLVVIPCSWIASQEWFSSDDFAFLVHVQRSDAWRWSDVFLPLEQRFWPFYRPLAMEAYFWTGFRVFGLHAAGFFGVSLLVHFASGGLVYRIARQWGFSAPGAWAAALLSVSRPPSLGEIYYGSVFHYVASRFLALATLVLFQQDLRGKSRLARAGSCAALGLALLCNEVNVAIPLLLVLGAVAAEPREGVFAVAVRAARRALPHFALIAAYLVFRFVLLAPSELRGIHTPSFGSHVARNAWVEIHAVFGGPGGLALAGLAVLAVALWLRRSGRFGSDGLRALRTSGVCIGWLALAGAPFAMLPFPQLRYSMLLEPAASLLLGVWLDAGFRVAAARRPRAAELALAAVAIAAIPFGTLATRLAQPATAPVLRLLEAVESLPGLRDDSRVVVLYGAPGLAAAEAAWKLRYLAYNGALLPAVHPESQMSLRFHDLAERPPRSVIRPGTRYLALADDQSLEPADAALLRRELPRGMEDTR